jgi:hypothetical protein
MRDTKGGSLKMDVVTVQIAIPQDKYRLLAEIAKERQKSMSELSVEAILDFVEREARLRQGREMLLTMPQRATRNYDAPSDLAREHNKYLYEE